MSFAEELAKLANLGILDHDGSLLGFRGNHIVNRQARGGGNSNCRWAGILIVADQWMISDVRAIDDQGRLTGPTHHNSETGSYGKVHILSKPRLLPFSFATFR